MCFLKVVGFYSVKGARSNKNEPPWTTSNPKLKKKISSSEGFYQFELN